NFPAYPKTVPNLIVRLEKDPQAQPHDKYDELKDALHWTPNLGSPGFASPAWMEVFNSSVLPRMFASVIKGERSAEDAASAAEAEVKRIAEKWAEKLAQKSKDAKRDIFQGEIMSIGKITSLIVFVITAVSIVAASPAEAPRKSPPLKIT